MTTATKKIPDETPITKIVSTLRSQNHLKAAGFVTLGDVRKRGLEKAIAVKYVGAVGMEELRAAVGPQTPVAPTEAGPEETIEFEENGLPLQLERTPSGPAFIAYSPAHKVAGPGGSGHRVQKSIFIEFDSRNRATVTARMYFMRKFHRNQDRVDTAIDEGRPWRQECYESLRTEFSAYGSGFMVLTE